jgi:NAD(P)-dependent dehydrogenase (short-subunit alcohol dehydrogenase family)
MVCASERPKGFSTASRHSEEFTKAFTARIPLGRMGEPDDIAKVVLFLSSSASDYMAGSLIVVDGGFLLS